MGLYLRKSIRVGPIRFNLSKSGVGISGGVTGFRLGTGPRGNYVHMGRHGLYFRKTFSQKSNVQQQQFHDNRRSTPEPVQTYDLTGVEDFREIESSDVERMADSSSKELLDEIRAKRKKLKLFPVVGVLAMIASLYLLSSNIPSWVTFGGLFCGFIVSGLAKYRDVMSKSVVIFYDLEDEPKETYSILHDAFEQLAACSKLWHIEAEGKVTDSKYHAGATGVVSRKGISLSKGKIPFIKTNIDVPKIPVGKQFLAFMPDRLLVFEPKAVGAVSYHDLEIQVEEQGFVEDDVVPRDAQVIDYTWKYVNKSGGPDKRFADNRQLPIALYGKLCFSSSSGLNEVIQLSKTGIGDPFRAAIQELAKVNQDLQERQSGEPPKVARITESKTESDLFKIGIQTFNSGDYHQAITAFNDVVKINPAHQLAYYNRGCVYIKLSEKKQAIEDLKTAAKLGHKKSQDILNSKGVSWT